MTRPPLTANGIEILARLRAGQSPAHIARVGWNRSSWSPADIAAVARDWSQRDDDGVAGNHGGGRRAKPIVHGTAAGWYQHRNRREQACKPCHEARKAAQRAAWREKRRQELAEAGPRPVQKSKRKPMPDGAPCCRWRQRELATAESDLRRVAKRAASQPTERNLAAVAIAKATVEDERELLLAHIAECTEEQAS